MYAMDVKSKNDPFLARMHHAIEGLGRTGIAGMYILDSFPIRMFTLAFVLWLDTSNVFQVKYVPDWIPGLPFKKALKEYGGAITESIETPFSIVKVRRHR